MSSTMPQGGGSAAGAEANAAATGAGSGPNAQGAGTSTGDDAKKECNKPAPTGDAYQAVRQNSPNSAVRRGMPSISPASQCPICLRPRGSGWAAATGRIYRNWSPDHIVPLKEISQMKGFGCLSQEDQKKVANNPTNFVPTCPPCNFARQDTDWNAFASAGGHPEFAMHGYLQQLTQSPQFQQLQQGIGGGLQNQINGMPWKKDP